MSSPNPTGPFTAALPLEIPLQKLGWLLGLAAGLIDMDAGHCIGFWWFTADSSFASVAVNEHVQGDSWFIRSRARGDHTPRLNWESSTVGAAKSAFSWTRMQEPVFLDFLENKGSGCWVIPQLR